MRPPLVKIKKADFVVWAVNDWCKQNGIERPHTEYKFASSIGRKWAFDMAWPDVKIAVEIQGGSWTGGRHTRGKGFASDCEKFSVAATMGWRLLQVTYEQCNSGQLLAWLGQVFDVEKAINQ